MPDRSARPRRLFRQPYPGASTATKAPAWCMPSAMRCALCARRPRGHVVSVVRRLRQLPAAAAELLRARPRPEVGRHARRRLDLAGEERRAGLQRVLSAILVRHLRADAGALCRQSAQRRAARTARPARLQRPDRRRRRAQCHEAEAGRELRRIRRRRGRIVGADGGENRGLRSDHCCGRSRPAACARPRARRHAYDQSQRLRRRGRRDPQDHRRRRALCAGNVGGAGGVSRSHRIA